MQINLPRLDTRKYLLKKVGVMESMLESNPHDGDGFKLALDDIVEYEGSEYLIVAISHRGKVSIRALDNKSRKGARWVEASLVSFIAGGEQA